VSGWWTAALGGDRGEDRDAGAAGRALLLFRDAGHAPCTHRLDPGDSPVRIGRRPDNALVIHWDDQVSRAHAELTWSGRCWVLRDAGRPRNGTFLNGRRLQAAVPLKDGDVVRMGRTLLVFQYQAAG
jgi:pSer/pThr/pTyr-binding forkhead associated (FHA) protein